MKYIIYDIEVLKNVFTLTAKIHNEDRYFTFEISPRKNEAIKLKDFMLLLQRENYFMVGFNSFHYDYPVLHTLIGAINDDSDPKTLAYIAYQKSQAVISASNRGGLGPYENVVWDTDVVVPQVDLFKIKHFDNQSNRVSLKRLEFNMRMRDIQEFELDFDKPLTKSSQIDKLLTYNKHDVLATDEFFNRIIENINFRQEISTKHNHNLLNYNDTKIGEWYLVNALEKIVPAENLYCRDEYGKRRKRGTHRDIIPLKDIIFDYIEFDCVELKELLVFMKSLKVFSIKGKFQWNEHDEYPNMIKPIDDLKKELTRLKKTKSEQTIVDNIQRRYNDMITKYCDHHIVINIDNCEFVVGKGGLHATNEEKVFYETDDLDLMDVDVESFYPTVGIVNGLFPEHIGPKFCSVYSEIKDLRFGYEKGTPENAMLKLALNGSYGKTNSEHSVLYDPQYMISTTINGQLMLLMLWDKLRVLDGIKLVQANTDGITLSYPKIIAKKVTSICTEWEKHTRLKLEYVNYQSMFTRDVNNYMAVYQKEGKTKVKEKGAYAFNELEWHKNHSNLVSRKAVYNYIVNGISMHKFITEHDNIFDFFKCTNINRVDRLITVTDYCRFDSDKEIYNVSGPGKNNSWHMTKPETGKLDTHYYQSEQRVTRYIVSNYGGVLLKIMKPLKGKTLDRYFNIEANYHVDVHNTVTSLDVRDYDINYQYYIDEANKLIKDLEI